MKKVLFQVILVVISITILCTGCKKTETTSWDLTVEANLGGDFNIVGTANITIEGDLFVAEITTTTIGGAEEVYNIELSGTVDGSTLIVTEDSFVLNTPNGNEYVTINSAEINKSKTSLSGSGTMTVTPAGMTTEITGDFTLTGTKM